MSDQDRFNALVHRITSRSPWSLISSSLRVLNRPYPVPEHLPDGSLAGIRNLPWETIGEILRYVGPGDLLALSQISRFFRERLIKDGPLWNDVLDMSGTPPMPTDLNVQQYVSLLCGTVCHYCGALDAGCDLWTIRQRCCTACLSSRQNFVLAKHIYEYMEYAEFEAIQPLLRRVPVVVPHHEGRLDWDEDSPCAPKEEYYIFKEIWEVTTALMITSSEERKAYEAERAKIVEGHKKRCNTFLMYADAIREQRVLRRVNEVGREFIRRDYGAELAFMDPFTGRFAFWEPGLLPFCQWRVWSFRELREGHPWRYHLTRLIVQADNVRLMARSLAYAKARTRRAYRALELALIPYRGRALPGPAEMGPFDVIGQKNVQILIDRKLTRGGGRIDEVGVDDISDEELASAVNAAFANGPAWEADRRDYLRKQLKETNDTKIDPLESASVFLWCYHCTSHFKREGALSDDPSSIECSHMTVEEALAHRCSYETLETSDWSGRIYRQWDSCPKPDYMQTWEVIHNDARGYTTHRHPCLSIRADLDICEQASFILSGLGLDALTTTRDMLGTSFSPVRHECGKVLETWNDAVKHSCSYRSDAWVRVNSTSV